MSKNNYMIKLYDFLERLSENNNREWFHENKSEFDDLRALWMTDIQSLIDRMSDYDETLRGVDAKDCVYRIYRDIRFSANKLPYKTYLGAILAHGGRKSLKSCYYIHFEPGNSGLHGGIWCPDTQILSRLRHEIDDNIEEFLGIVNNVEFSSRYSFVGNTLKMMPKGFPKDLPHAKYIKMKEYLVTMPKPDTFFRSENWIEKSAEDFKAMKPLHDFLNYVFD